MGDGAVGEGRQSGGFWAPACVCLKTPDPEGRPRGMSAAHLPTGGGCHVAGPQFPIC